MGPSTFCRSRGQVSLSTRNTKEPHTARCAVLRALWPPAVLLVSVPGPGFPWVFGGVWGGGKGILKTISLRSCQSRPRQHLGGAGRVFGVRRPLLLLRVQRRCIWSLLARPPRPPRLFLYILFSIHLIFCVFIFCTPMDIYIYEYLIYTYYLSYS